MPLVYWTEADTELLVRLDRENPLLEKPALLLLFNSQASQPRSLLAITGKLYTVQSRPAGAGKRRRGWSSKVESVTDQQHEDEGDESDVVSEVSTVRSSHQEETLQADLPLPRPDHPTPKRPKRPPAVADDDDAVTELQAIKTQRGLVRAMAELAEMEKAYLAKHGERE